MKKIYITIASLWALSAMNAQVLTNGFTKGQLLNTNYFLDASSFQGQADPSNGKLLGFPKTDLTKFKFDLGVVTDEVTLSGFDGVIVYNTVSGKVGQNADGGYTADSMGKQVAVEPGFYYFSNPNGADNQSVTEGKWIRLSDAEVSTQLWVQRQNGSITETYLKAVEGSKDFFGYQNNGDQKGERIIKVLGEPMITDNESSVYAENYLKSSINFEFFTSNAFPLSHPLSDDSFYNFNYRRNQILPDHINNSTSSLLRYNGGYNTLKIETGVSKDIDYFNGQTFQTFIGGLKDSNGEYSNININANKVVGLQAWSNIYTTGKIDQSYGLIVNSTNRGAGEVTNLRGQYIYTDVNNSKSNNVVGLYNNTAIKNNASIELGRGIASYFSVDENSAVAVNTKGIDNRYIGNSGTTNPEHIGIFNSFRLEDGATVEDFYGYRLHLPVSSNATVNRAYGIHLDDIDFADTDNYAIYTRKGAIRFGGLADNTISENRIVVANTDGILSTKEISEFKSPWEKEGEDSKLVYPKTDYIRKYTADGGFEDYYKNPIYNGLNTDVPTFRGEKEYNIVDDFSAHNRQLVRASSISVKGNIERKVSNMDILDIDDSSTNVFHVNRWNQAFIRGGASEGRGVDGIFSQVAHFGTAKTGLLRGIYSSTALNGLQSRASRAVGGFFDVVSNTDADTDDLYATFLRIRLNGAGHINRIFGSKVELTTRTSNYTVTSNVDDVYLNYVGLYNLSKDNYTGTITNSYDFFSEVNDLGGKITNHYGLFIQGEHKTNYVAGKTGIGTKVPTEKLEVAGAVKAESFKGTNGATLFPDYVFENYYTGTSTAKADYNFANLSQVEDFVKTNGHLPGYVSAKEIKAQGYIDIMDTQLTNVEKIEELYLHTIEQDKAIKAQKEELKAKDAKIEKLELDVQELKSLVQQLLNK